jgi:hypothetical protein
MRVIQQRKMDVPHTASAFCLPRHPFGNNPKSPRRNPMFKMFSMMTLYGSLMISAAYAQSSQPIQAKVPFAFVTQDAKLAAGSYQLTYNTSAHTLRIRNLDQNADSAFATAVPDGLASFRCGPLRCE